MMRPVEGSARRALVLLVSSGLALVGLVALVVMWVLVGVGALETGRDATSPCVVAFDDGTHDADVRFSAFPPQSVCTWTVDGVTQEVVVASAPRGLVAGAVAAAVVGAGTAAVVAFTGRRRPVRA